MTDDYKTCKNPLCDRLVRPCVAYCCGPCRDGKLREGMKAGVEEIDHSGRCWVRHERRQRGERGPNDQ